MGVDAGSHNFVSRDPEAAWELACPGARNADSNDEGKHNDAMLLNPTRL